MFGNLDPAKVSKVQDMTKSVKAEILTDFDGDVLTIKFKGSENNAVVVDNILEQFTKALSQQLSMFFKIKGDISYKGKKL